MRELTRDEIIEAALSTERELADERQPRKQPGGELLRKDRPVEGLLTIATPLQACRIGHTNRILGRRGCAVIMDPALGAVLVEIGQAYGKV